MRRIETKLFAVLLLFPLSIFSNDASGVKEVNYRIGIDYHELKLDGLDGHIKSTILSESISFPIYKYLGSSISLGGYKGNKIDYYHFYAQTKGHFIDGSVFVRDKSIGKIGVGLVYDKSKTEIEPINTNIFLMQGSVTNTSKNYSLYGSYYLDNFTFNFNRNKLKSDSGFNTNILGVGASYYIEKNTLIGIGKLYMDSPNKYSVNIVHQPYLFNNSIDIQLAYADDDYGNTISFYVNYHFQTQVSLKTRKREYQ